MLIQCPIAVPIQLTMPATIGQETTTDRAPDHRAYKPAAYSACAEYDRYYQKRRLFQCHRPKNYECAATSDRQFHPVCTALVFPN